MESDHPKEEAPAVDTSSIPAPLDVNTTIDSKNVADMVDELVFKKLETPEASASDPNYPIGAPIEGLASSAQEIYKTVERKGLSYHVPSQIKPTLQPTPATSSPTAAALVGADVMHKSPHYALVQNSWKRTDNSNYEIILSKGSSGLCMNVEIHPQGARVSGFRPTPEGEKGPAELSGRIAPGDNFVSVNDIPIDSAASFRSTIPLLKSPDPVKLVFQRPVASTAPSFSPLSEAPVHPSVLKLNDPRIYTKGMSTQGVRYLGPNRWAAEVPLPMGGVRRLGEFASEQQAAMVYNQAIYQHYGNQGFNLMNPASPFPRTAPTPVQERKAQAYFTLEQKSQLRAQIMAFKYLNGSEGIPPVVLSAALRQIVRDPHARPNHRPLKFKETVVPKINRKKRKKKSRRQKEYDSSDEDDDSDDAFDPSAAAAVPTRRSSRNSAKKVKKYNVDLSDEEEDLESDKEKNEEPVVEEDTGPQVDKIVGIRFIGDDKNDDDPIMQFYVKWKNKSYLHLTWMTTEELEDCGRTNTGRIRRYLQQNAILVDEAKMNMIIRGDENKDDTVYFNPNFIEVDRILDVRQVDVEVKEEQEKKALSDETGSTKEESDQVKPEQVTNGSSEVKKDSSSHMAVEEPDRSEKPVAKEEVKDVSAAPERKKLEYLVKWRDLSYVECTWEDEDLVKSDRLIAQYHRMNHPPLMNGAHPAMTSDIRPPASAWAKYQESPVYGGSNKLRNYQLEGLNWMIFCWYNRRNCILADEMGLGKTIQAVSVLEHLRQREHIRGPFLVVAPLATLGNWKREIETWTTMNCVVYHDSEGGAETRRFIREHEFYYQKNAEYYRRRSVYKFNVLVTSFNILLTDSEILENIHWRYMVVDEAHKLKNREAKILQTMQGYRRDSCLLMTGTPLQNGVYELWSLLNFIEPEKFTSQQEFYDQYGDLSSADQVAALHEQVRPYMLRRVKEDVEKSIPPKEETIIDVEMTTLQKKYYRAIFERNRSFLSQNSGGGSIPIASLVNVEMELRKCCNHPFLIRGVEEKECRHISDERLRMEKLIQASGKMILLDKILAKFSAEGSKVLIFSQFKIMLDVIEDLMHMRRYNFERMDGSLRGNERQCAIDRFNDKKSKTFAFLLSTRAGGVGINLIAANVVILYDSDWNPQNDLQAVARCHRIGQTQAVQIYRLVTTKTYEAQMFAIASKKLGMHQAVFETGGVRSGFSGDDTGGKDMMSLLSLDRDKIEMMIRYGAYAIMGDEEDQQDKNNDVDIDQILSKSRVIRYDESKEKQAGDGDGDDSADGDSSEKKETKPGAAAALSFSKATFIAETSDSTIDFNDDQFWEKVLGPKSIEKIRSKLEDGFLNRATTEETKEFLMELRELARSVVRERQKGDVFEDAEAVLAILVELKVVGVVKKGEYNIREIADEWLKIIERPKRRRNQEADSELMYHSFLDGELKKPTNKGPRKKKGDPLSGRKASRRQSTPKKRRQVKSGIRIRLAALAEDEGYKLVQVHSKVAKVQKQLTALKKRKSKRRVESSSDEQTEDDEEEDEEEEEDDDDSDFMEEAEKREIVLAEETSQPSDPIATPGPVASAGDEDMWCRVCYSAEGYADDPIVQCESCKIAVHKYCYGIESVPEGDIPWYCNPCAEKVERPIACAVCPIENAGAFKKSVEGEWVHVVCGLWIPGIHFGNVERMDKLKNVHKVKQELAETTCVICNKSGACIKCSSEDCDVMYHPICARGQSSVKMFMNKDGQLISYCEEHAEKK